MNKIPDHASSSSEDINGGSLPPETLMNNHNRHKLMFRTRVIRFLAFHGCPHVIPKSGSRLSFRIACPLITALTVAIP